MEIIAAHNGKFSAKDINRAVEAFKNGEVVMHATETCYGFAVDIFQEKALQKLYRLKKMSLEKPTSMMVTDLSMARSYAKFNDGALLLADKFWRGPLTLVIDRKPALPSFFNKGHTTVGIRCPSFSLAQALIKAYGKPLSTTSANISGKPETYCVKDYLLQLLKQDEKPALILDQGTLPLNRPSTIVGFRKEDGYEEAFIIREGAMATEVKAFMENFI